MKTIRVEIDAHDDGIHCGMCWGRWDNADRCDVYRVPLKNVRSYLRQAVRCEECLKGEVKDENRN